MSLPDQNLDDLLSKMEEDASSELRERGSEALASFLCDQKGFKTSEEALTYYERASSDEKTRIQQLTLSSLRKANPNQEN